MGQMAADKIEFVCDDCDGKVVSSVPKAPGIGMFMAMIQTRVREIHQEERGCASHNRISARNLPSNVEGLVEVSSTGNSSSGEFPKRGKLTFL